MTFQWPYMLLLGLAPLLILFLQRSREGGQPDPFPHIKSGSVERGQVRFASRPGSRRNVHWRFWAAMMMAVIALSRPQWGRSEQASYVPAAEMLIALDLSRSMLGKDVAPTRLERARLLAAEVAAGLPGHKIGLIGFAGSAHLLAPPSDERNLYNSFLSDLLPGHVVDQGTNFASLFEVAVASFSPAAAQRTLLILSDGEAESGQWRDRLRQLSAKDVKGITIGVGTAEGAIVPGPDGTPILDEAGSPILSRLDPGALREIADGLDGNYLDGARTGEVVRSVQAYLVNSAAAADGSSELRKAEQFAWFLGAALLFLAWSASREWVARPRIRRMATPVAGAAAICLAVLGSGAFLRPNAAVAADDLHEEDDPLETVLATAARLVKKSRLNADDYLEFANAATRYGEVKRGLAKPLSEGVLHDGLAAIERGRRLNPALDEWQDLEAKLKRLLVPPPPVPEDGSTPPDPANEPVDASREAPVPELGKDEPPEDGEEKDAEGPAEKQGTQTVGGSRRDVYVEGDWGDSSLATPLYQLEQIRGTGSPAELFRLMQKPTQAEDEGQEW